MSNQWNCLLNPYGMNREARLEPTANRRPWTGNRPFAVVLRRSKSGLILVTFSEMNGTVNWNGDQKRDHEAKRLPTSGYWALIWTELYESFMMSREESWKPVRCYSIVFAWLDRTEFQPRSRRPSEAARGSDHVNHILKYPLVGFLDRNRPRGTVDNTTRYATGNAVFSSGFASEVWYVENKNPVISVA